MTTDRVEGGGRKAERRRGTAAEAVVRRAAPPSPEGRWKKIMASKGKENKSSGEEGRVGGHRGRCKGCSGMLTHMGGLAYTGCIQVLVALQQWSAPPWGDRGQHSMAYMVVGTGSHACAALQRAKQESLAPLCAQTGCRTHRILAALLECREVHNISDGDPPARPERDWLWRNPEKYFMQARCLGGGGV